MMIDPHTPPIPNDSKIEDQSRVPAPFLKTFQNWFAKLHPTRQFTPTDLFWMLQWAKTGITAHALTQKFDEFLEKNRNFFNHQPLRLSKLQFEANRIIAEYFRTHRTVCTPKIDPYACRLDKLTNLKLPQCQGRSLCDAVHQMCDELEMSSKKANEIYLHWKDIDEAYYRYCAQCIADWQRCLRHLIKSALELLTPCERQKIESLDARENFHIQRLSSEEALRYRERLMQDRIAKCFGIEDLFKS